MLAISRAVTLPNHRASVAGRGGVGGQIHVRTDGRGKTYSAASAGAMYRKRNFGAEKRMPANAAGAPASRIGWL